MQPIAIVGLLLFYSFSGTSCANTTNYLESKINTKLQDKESASTVPFPRVENSQVTDLNNMSPALKVEVIVVAGERMRDLCKRLESAGITTENAFLELAKNGEFPGVDMVPPRIPAISRFEGLFVPGSYSFRTDKLMPLGLARDKMSQAISNARLIADTFFESAKSRYAALRSANGVSPYEQIVIASIVEKEAVAGKDFSKIAQVFLTRFKRGGRLGSCPVVEYALGYHRPFLTKKDISIVSPYNVYANNGLPPTPICFFSDSALDGVKNPSNTYYYYFVYDWITRELAFASKYEDHVRNSGLARSHYIEAYGTDAMTEIRYDRFYSE
jgi:UPF0755 protein